jgi:hypothetical protein
MGLRVAAFVLLGAILVPVSAISAPLRMRSILRELERSESSDPKRPVHLGVIHNLLAPMSQGEAKSGSLPQSLVLKPGTLKTIAETLRQVLRPTQRAGGRSQWVASRIIGRELAEPKVVARAEDTGLDAYPERVALLGAFDLEPSPQQVELGTMIARAGLPLSTGAGNGAPHWIQLAARLAGGYTVGFAHAQGLDDHLAGGRPIDAIDRFYATHAGPGLGNTEREAPLIQQNNIRIMYGGGIGTLCEFLLSFYEPGVVGIMKGVGGVNDAVLPILPHLSLPKATPIVTARTNREMLARTRAALRKVPTAGPFPSSLVRIGPNEVFPVGARDRENILSFFVHHAGLSGEDRARIDELIDRVAAGGVSGARPTVVVPDRSGLTEQVADRAVEHKLSTVVVSSDSAREREQQVRGRRLVSLGKGPGVGEFASLREVVQDARVVFAAGGDYKSLAGVAFALNDTKLPVIAILETDGGLSAHLREFLGKFKSNSATIVFDRDPEQLLRKVNEAIAAKKSG